MSQSGREIDTSLNRREPVLSRSRSVSLRKEIEAKLKKNLLDKALIENYILLKSTEVDSLFSNIRTIKLEGFRITETILDVLKKTDQSEITTIILRNITFDLVQTCTNFLDFLGINVHLKILILDGVDVNKVNFKELLDRLETFKYLEVLKFRGFKITELFDAKYFRFDFKFMKILIKLGQLKFLLFTNNIIDKKIYDYLFNDYVDINLYYFIDLGEDGSYLKHNLSIIPTEYIKTHPHYGEHYMRIIEIDTDEKIKKRGECVNRRDAITVHTFNNKTNNKKDVLIDFINENVLNVLIVNLEKHSVDDETIDDEIDNFYKNYQK